MLSGGIARSAFQASRGQNALNRLRIGGPSIQSTKGSRVFTPAGGALEVRPSTLAQQFSLMMMQCGFFGANRKLVDASKPSVEHSA